MSYRNIVVNDRTYKFVIGKQFTKVVDVGIVSNEIIGKQAGYGRYDWSNPDKNRPLRFAVTPADIRRFILAGGKIDEHFHDGPHTCRCGHTGDDVRYRANPFAAEIYEKEHFGYMCENCAHESAMDI